MIDTITDYTIGISKEQLAELPRVEYHGQAVVIDNIPDMKKAVNTLKKYSILGFDTESKPTFRKGATIHVSLIQIAADDICFLFRIRKLKDISLLKDIIESEDILKIGLSLHDDFNMLAHDYKLEPKGFVDLQKLVPKYKFANISLQKIYAILFNERIPKNQQLSNWDAENLSNAQMSYAAIDAWTCIQIYRKLVTGNFNPDTSMYKVYNTVDNEA